MRNPVVRSALVVFAFWWIVIYAHGLLTGQPTQAADVHAFVPALIKIGAAAICSVICLSWMARWAANGSLASCAVRGIESSIGLVPGGTVLKRAGNRNLQIDAARWPTVATWREHASREYRNAFDAILATLTAHADWPSSPMPGGHGGATLLQHSLNVADYGLARVQTWRYERKANDPLHGASLSSQDVNAAALILLGHDLGKLHAYRIEDGAVVEWRRSHDREGARILASLPELWVLPDDDRKAVVAAVAHEHHPHDLPTHTGERTRLLMEFLIDSDTGASKKEEGKTESPVSVEEDQHAPQNASHKGDDEREAIWQWFLDLLSKPNCINGNDKRFRVGFKDKAGRLVINESSIRKQLAEDFYKNVLVGEDRKGDGRYKISEILLQTLDEKGVLLKEWNGLRFTYKNALFEAVARGENGIIIGKWSAALVVEMGEHMPAGVQRLSPAPRAPEISGALFPQRALRNTSTSAAAPAENCAPAAPAAPSSLIGEVHDPHEPDLTLSGSLAGLEAESWDTPATISGCSPQPSTAPIMEIADLFPREHEPTDTEAGVISTPSKTPTTDATLIEDADAELVTEFDFGATEALDAAADKLKRSHKQRTQSSVNERRVADRLAVLKCIPAQTCNTDNLRNSKPNRKDPADNRNYAPSVVDVDQQPCEIRASSCCEILHCTDTRLLRGRFVSAVLRAADGSTFSRNGEIVLSAQDAVRLAAKSGVNVHDLNAFMNTLPNEKHDLWFAGGTFIRTDKGEIISISIRTEDKDAVGN